MGKNCRTLDKNDRAWQVDLQTIDGEDSHPIITSRGAQHNKVGDYGCISSKTKACGTLAPTLPYILDLVRLSRLSRTAVESSHSYWVAQCIEHRARAVDRSM